MDNQTSSIAAKVFRRIGAVIIALAGLLVLGLIGWLCYRYSYDLNWDNLLQSQQTAFGMALGIAFLIIIMPLAVLSLLICAAGHISLIKSSDEQSKKTLLRLTVTDILTLLFVLFYYFETGTWYFFCLERHFCC